MRQTNARRAATSIKLLAAATLWMLSIIAAFGCGVIVGVFHRGEACYQELYEQDASLIGRITAGKDEYQGLTMERMSSGGAYLSGTVSSSEVKDQLSREIATEFGETKCRVVIAGVDVAGN